MRRSRVFAAVLLAAILAFAPGLAMARAGGGSSFGSRGMRTFSAPPTTGTAPYSAAPMQRSLTPEQTPSYGATSGLASRGFGSGFGGRSPFVSGLMGGLIGAGIGGMLFGHGMFGGIDGVGGFFGLLLQIFLVVMVGRWLFRRFFRQPAMAGGGSLFSRMGTGIGGVRPGGSGAPLSGAAAGPAIQVTPADFKAFEQLLQAVQAAWSGHDLNAMRGVTTPEMVSYFAEQLGEQTSRGVRNVVGDVRLEKGDLAEAWAEGGREYATVAMNFSMIDVTRDASGRIVDGSPSERTSATEIWTFMRSPGGRWILSAIQQAR